MSNGSTFLYHAHGTAFGGVIRRPFSQAIVSQAPASLPVSGGYGSASASDFKFNELISFRAANTQVSGSKSANDGSYNTVATTMIEGLNIDHMVTADRIVARVATIHSPGDTETRVFPSGSHFVNLRIAGRPVEPDLDIGVFCQFNTAEGFKKEYKSNSVFKKEMRKRFLWGELDKSAPEFLRKRYKWQGDEKLDPESKGIMPCSLVKSVSHDAPELVVLGNVVVVPSFGVIHLAEYHVKESARRLTMLRLELGSPFEGDLTVCGVEGNGTSYP